MQHCNRRKIIRVERKKVRALFDMVINLGRVVCRCQTERYEGHWSQHLNLRTASMTLATGWLLSNTTGAAGINDWSLFGARHRYSSSGHAVTKM